LSRELDLWQTAARLYGGIRFEERYALR
jgi:hypothetical protein